MRAWIIAAAVILAGCATAQSEPSSAKFSHFVLFDLAAEDRAAHEAFTKTLDTYLKGHPGEVSYATGLRAADMSREVNLQDYDVTLHIVFETKAAHDVYQTAERHLRFIDLHKTEWTSVRVVDTYVVD
jgi:hypothetical protein